ncbi:GntR family transcriptional regulator [Rhizorhabdus histidinilytica]|jgi:DNA-binding GntR family transcriptional regulator|uniref:Transcriptional regulator, GntR family n=1 Tax=Rhizorhabdus histidinilytica TaxID=439228 RepID=A0A1T5EKZ7_9SPHN|nr:FCD domain-containing protein [Rhizorhabdus histidinilytica]QEH76796.1 FCD domain-containing protein [Sphingomonas sp. C8-2]SKB84340.1 transcriptional regulator, GntR family [Rhizorhabdus histidinilytica]
MSVDSPTVLRSHTLWGGTLGTDVLRRLREDIISCVLKPGEKLRFETLRSLYGVSYSTLREALSRLSAEGLVVSEGQRGFFVAPITEEDLLDITDARVLLERECIRRSLENGNADWEAGIIAAFHKLDRLEQSMGEELRTTPDWDLLHKQFHDALVASAGSPIFAELRHLLFERARRYRRMSALVRKQPRQKSNEHRVMMEAVLGGDKELAMELTERHIREVAQNLLRNVFRRTDGE